MKTSKDLSLVMSVIIDKLLVRDKNNGGEYSGLDLFSLAQQVLSCDKFLICSGASSPGRHHYGTGQLLQHTYEVMYLAMAQAQEYESITGHQVNLINLYFACLFHDYGKIYDYERDGDEWVKTVHYSKVRHISRSFAFWEEQAKLAGLTEKDIAEVSHAILAHHMLPEWGSPIGPQSDIAWILHLSDQSSAQLFKFKGK